MAGEKKPQLGVIYNMLGEVELHLGNLAAAKDYFEKSLPLRRETIDKKGEMFTLRNMAAVAYAQADYQRASSLYEDSLSVLREIKDIRGIADVYRALGHVARAEGELRRAMEYYLHSIREAKTQGDSGRRAAGLDGLAGVYCIQGQYKQAVRLFAAAMALRESSGMPPSSVEPAGYLPDIGYALAHDDIAKARAALGDAIYAAEWAAGQESLEQAIDEALLHMT